MKYGIAIIWDGPSNDPDPEVKRKCDEHYREAMLNMLAKELADTNRHFKKHGLAPLNFTMMTRDETQVKADC